MTKEWLAKAIEKIVSNYTGDIVEWEIVSGNIELKMEGNLLTFLYDKAGNLYKVSYENWVEAVSWIKNLKEVLNENNKIDFKKGNISLILEIHNNSIFTTAILASSFNTINNISAWFKKSRYREELKEHIQLLDDYANKLNSLKTSKQLKDLIEKVRLEFEIHYNM